MATTVFRIEKNKEYVVMSNKFLREREMSLKAKGLLALCLALPDDWNYSLNGLCAICKESQTSIRSALKELETFRYLKRKRSKDDKGQFVYEYIIYETPYAENPHTVKGHTEKQHTDNQHTENQSTENVRQQSIKKESIKKENIKEQNKEDIYIDKFNEILKHITDFEMKNLYVDYIEMRKNIGAPITERGLSMLINRCARLANFDRDIQKALLETAIINNWKNVYMPQQKEVPVSKRNNKAWEQLKDFYADDDKPY